MSFILTHLSDLHFNAYPEKMSDWNLKRVLGAANLYMKRAKHHPLSRNRLLVKRVLELEWDHLVISGDLTQLGLEHEFEQARKELDPLLQEKLQDLIARALGLMTRTHQRNMAHSSQEIGEPLIGLDQHEFSPNREHAFQKMPSHLGEIHWKSSPQP